MDGEIFMDGKRIEEIGDERFVDTYTKEEHTRNSFNQPYIGQGDVELLTHGMGMELTSVPKLNKVIGGVLADVQEASFISQSTLSAVPGYDSRLPYHVPGRGPLFPNSNTLSAQRLAATLYNRSADTVRSVIDLVGDKELSERASEIKGDESDVAKSNPTIQFQSTASYEGTMRHTEVLSQEAQELLDLFGEGSVDSIRGLVQRAAETILTRADLSYGSLLTDTDILTRDVADVKNPEIDGDVDYSTLNPKDFILMMRRSLEYAVANVVMGLLDHRRDQIFERMKAVDAA